MVRRNITKVTVIIPDSHAEPGVNNRRFIAAGNFIADRKPDTLVDLGDHFDFPSLSHYDKGKKVEGRYIKDDLEVGLDAFDKLFTPIRKMKKEPYSVFIEGNHEYRLDRRLNDESVIDGIVTKKSLCLEDYWDVVVPYRKYIVLDGVTYTHHFTAGHMGKVISSSTNQARAISLKRPGIIGVQGHSHTWDVAMPVVNGKTNSVLVAGCFFEQDTSYMDQFGNEDYWRGLTILHHLESGGFDIEQYSMERLLKDYL